MSNSFEYEGKSVEDALEKAGRALKIPKDKIQYTVISYGSTGIFGLVGVKKAKIRVKSSKERKDTEKASVLSLVDEAFGTTEKKKTGSSKPKTDKKTRSSGPEKKQETPAQGKKEDLEKGGGNKTSASPARHKPPRKPRGSKPAEAGKNKIAEQEKATDAETPLEQALPPLEESSFTEEEIPGFDFPESEDFSPDSSEEEGRSFVEPSAGMVEQGREALEKILSSISEDIGIESEISGGRILYNLKSANAAILIGKRGQTLEAIQYIVDKILNKDQEGRVRIQLDVEGYIETRKAQLQQLALKQAEKAKKTGKPATIGQMSAHDRRIIHLTLKDDRGVRTQSVGEGFYRRLVIFPKKANRRRGPHKGES